MLRGEDDQVVPFATTGKISAGIVKGAKLISPGYPHEMPATLAAQISADLLAFIKA